MKASDSTGSVDTSSRRTAIRVLSRWIDANAFPDRIIPDVPDRGFVMDMVYGTVRQRRALEWLLTQQVAHMPGGETLAALRTRLAETLRAIGDPRALGRGWEFECVPYLWSAMPRLPAGFPAFDCTRWQSRFIPAGETPRFEGHRPTDP